jgi:fluoride exporter
VSVVAWLSRVRGPRIDVLAAIALGGAVGTVCRYGIAEAMARRPGGFPWATLVANTLGCLLIGVLMVLLTERSGAPRLMRPFLGVGVLGGFTTFSTYAVEIELLTREGAPGAAMTYLVVTPVAALAAVALGTLIARLVFTRRLRPWGTS